MLPGNGTSYVRSSTGRDGVRHLVYVAAFALDVDESPSALLADSDPDLWTFEDRIVMVGSARRTPTELLYADVEPELAAASAARLTPQSSVVYSEPLTRAAWREKPSTFVVTTQDAVLAPLTQEMLAARAGSDVHHIDTSHSPFLSQPDVLAAILVAAAGNGVRIGGVSQGAVATAQHQRAQPRRRTVCR